MRGSEFPQVSPRITASRAGQQPTGVRRWSTPRRGDGDVSAPAVTRVGGLKLWNSLGYHVAPGEKAIWILAPILKRERDEASGEETERCVGFRPCPVWDASQLKEIAERPLPSLWSVLPDDVTEVYHHVKARIEGTGIVVEERVLPGSIQGVSQGGRILIRSGLDSRNGLFTLLHELVHELEHQGEGQEVKPTEVREFEAESVAYVAAATLGLEHPTARDYLLSYRGSAEQLRSSLGTVQRLVRQVLAIVGEREPSAEPARAAGR